MEFGVSFVVEVFYCGVFDCLVYVFDLVVGLGMFGFGEVMIDIVVGVGYDESMCLEEFFLFDFFFDVSCGLIVVGWVGEVSVIVCEDGVNFIRYGIDEIL